MSNESDELEKKAKSDLITEDIVKLMILEFAKGNPLYLDIHFIFLYQIFNNRNLSFKICASRVMIFCCN